MFRVNERSREEKNPHTAGNKMTRREFSPSSTSSALLPPHPPSSTEKNRKVFITFNRLLIYLNVSFMCFHVDCVFSLPPAPTSLYCLRLSFFLKHQLSDFHQLYLRSNRVFIFSPSQENHFSRLLRAAKKNENISTSSFRLSFLSLSLFMCRRKNHFNFCCSMLIAIYSMLPIFFSVLLHFFGTIECHSIFISFAIPLTFFSHTLFRFNIVCSRCRKFPIIWISYPPMPVRPIYRV